MKPIYKILVLVIFLSFSEFSFANLPGFSYYKTLTIQSSMVAGTGNHINFPVLISHTDSDLKSVSNGGKVQNINGFDIAFSDATGTTQLNHQIESYNPVTGEITMWVQVPNVSALVNTTIRIYYGNSSISTDPSTTNTWDNNFKAVYHLNNQFTDGTSNGVDCNNITTTSIAGIADQGRQFTAGTYLEASANSAVQITGDLTVSAWVKNPTLQTGAKENVLITCSNVGEMPFRNTLYYFNILSTGQLNIYWENGAGFDNNVTSTNTVTFSGQYTLLTVTRDATNKKVYFYQNGVLIDGPISYSNNADNGSTSHLRLGESQENSADDFEGNIDEARISNSVRSQDWIITTYNSINNPSTFYNMGSEVYICNPPNITACQSNVLVMANTSCSYTLIDYTSSVTATDNCGGGLTYTQIPAAGTNLFPGVYPIKIYVSDMNGQKDSCNFDLTVMSTVNPTVVSCGDLFTNETTQGHINNGNGFSCSTSSTPGEDIFYQITVPDGNYQIKVTLTNATDANDSQINAYWVGSNCPSSGACIQEYLYDIGTGTFTVNNSNQIILYASGPGTYFFVVDSQTDHIDNYNIKFDCIVSGIEFDESNCGSDTNNDGIYASVNGSNVLTVEPCQNVTISHTIYIKNVNNAEWLDSVNLQLGSCYTNINNSTLTPDLPTQNTGFYNTQGEWSAVYDNVNNFIDWSFTHSNPTPTWGDGVGLQYSCYAYTFSFDATISSTCTQNSDLNIQINVSDDGVATSGATVAGYDYALSSDFMLNLPNVGWKYDTTSFCQGGTNPLPTINIPGGTFSSSPPGLSLNASSGEIDLANSNQGNYNVTYSNGLCPTDSTIVITINPDDDPSFSYQNNSYCQGGSDPSAIITGTSGGTFSSNSTGLVFLDNSTGEIDVSASTPGTYIITYQTPVTNSCPKSSTFNLTINAEDNPSFNYLYPDYCQGDLDPNAFGIVTSGTFSSDAGLIFADNTTGLIDLSASTIGLHTITYTTNGPCPNSSTFNLNIHQEQDPSFSYPSSSYCNDETDPVPTITGVNGGVFASPSGASLNATTGVIDLDASTTINHLITYTTPGPFCANTDTFNLTINLADDPNFNYLYNHYCQGDNDPNAYGIVTSGTFSSDAGLIFLDNTTGLIDLSATTPGLHSITYTTVGLLCPRSQNFSVTIIAEETPTFSYNSPFCQGDVNPFPVYGSTTTTGGTFSANLSGLVIDATTGEINLANSTPGTYVVTYTTPGINCQNSATYTITINPEQDPSFSYPSSPYCENGNDLTPIISGTQNGSFTGSSGLLFDASTGVIDLTQSPPNTYTITYTTPGPNCPNDSTKSITITPLDDPSFSYNDTLFCQGGGNAIVSVQGTTPGIFSNSTSIVFDSNTPGNIIVDSSPIGTHSITYTTLGTCSNDSTLNIIIEPEQFSVFSYPLSDYCQGENDSIHPSISGTAGGTFSNSSGIVFVNASNGIILIDSSSIGTHVITYITPGPNCKDTSVFNITIYPEEDASFVYNDTLFCKADPNPIANISGTPNGVFTNSTGIVFTSSPSSDGQIDLSQSSPGIHTITYTTPSNLCPKVSTFNVYIVENQVANFSYNDITFCQRDDNPFPTITGTAGGTFSNSTGITFVDTLTGQIDLLNSGVGTHAITYTTPGPNCVDDSVFIVTILPQDTAVINYSQSTYCTSFSNPVPVVTGSQGGSFASDVDIIIDPTTGEIDIDNTTVGEHIIYYTTADVNCPYTTSDTIVIENKEDPSFAFDKNAFCVIDDNPTPVINGVGGGTFYNYSGVVFIDSLTGEINLLQSTIGQHDITYITPGIYCSDTLTIGIYIKEPQIAYAGEDQILEFKFETILNANDNYIGNAYWLGNNNYQFSDVNDPNADISNLNLGDNKLIWVIADSICPFSYDSLLITVKDIVVPQIITPNNDAKNDVLFIENIDLLENTVEIYNRWGQLVYKTENYQNNWEGTDLKGNQLMNDTYFYLIKVKGKIYKGFIVIKR